MNWDNFLVLVMLNVPAERRGKNIYFVIYNDDAMKADLLGWDAEIVLGKVCWNI